MEKWSNRRQFARQVELWRDLNETNRDLVLMGDANFCSKSCDSPDYPSNLKNISNIANDFYLEESFVHLVEENTRTELRGDYVQRSCIDHISTNSPGKCKNVAVIPAGNSDHLAIMVTKLSKEVRRKPDVVKKRSYKTFSEEDFLREIKYTNFQPVLEE